MFFLWLILNPVHYIRVLQKIDQQLEQQEVGQEIGDRWIELESYPYKYFVPHFREKSFSHNESDHDSEVEEDDDQDDSENA